MADIDVVKKGSSRNWVWWVVAAVAIVVVVMMLMRRNDDTRRAPGTSSLVRTADVVAA